MAKKDEVDEVFEALEEDAKEKILECDKLMTECFRRVFSTPEGKIVLHQLLKDLEFFNYKISNEREIALNNYAKFMIFKRLGCNNDKQISDAIFNCNKK
jgi:hypothetical protein